MLKYVCVLACVDFYLSLKTIFGDVIHIQAYRAWLFWGSGMGWMVG